MRLIRTCTIDLIFPLEDKKVTESFKSELKVDRTHDVNCVGSKQDDKSEGESKDCSICKQEGNLLGAKVGVFSEVQRSCSCS